MSIDECRSGVLPGAAAVWNALDFVIRYSPFDIRHSIFVIRHSSFDIRHSTFVIRHSSFDIRHSVFAIPTW